MLESGAYTSAGHLALGSRHAFPAAAFPPLLSASQAPAQLSSPKSYTDFGQLPALVFAFLGDFSSPFSVLDSSF